MTFTLAGTTLPSYTDFQSKTAWVAARREMLNGGAGADVTANLRTFTISWPALTAAQRNTLRTLYYTNTSQRLIVSDRTIDCYVFCQSLSVKRTLSSNYPYEAKLSLVEHGTTYSGDASATSEPSDGASDTWQLGASGSEAAIPTPSEYTVEYQKAAVMHELAGGLTWMDVLGISRRFILGYPIKAIADIDVFRTKQALKAALHFLTPTTWDSVDTTVVLREFPETQDTKLTGTTGRADVVLEETGGATVAQPSCKVEIDSDGDGDYSGTPGDYDSTKASASVAAEYPDPTYGAGIAWTTPANAKTSNDAYATVASDDVLIESKYLGTLGFGFAIPNGATITGVKVEVEGKDPDQWFYINGVSLIVGGSITGTAKTPTEQFAVADSFLSFGGSTDLWGLALTPAMVNEVDFGAAIAFGALGDDAGGPFTLSVDSFRITVYYTTHIEDVSAYVSAVTIDRKGINAQSGPSGVGGGISHEARINFRHGGGIFSPFNTANRLTDQFYGKLVRISLGWAGSPTVVFVGRILMPSEDLKARTATLVARDLGAFLLQNKRGDTALYQNTPSKTYLAAILAAAGLTEGTGAGQYQLDTGNYALPLAWMDRETYAGEVDQVAAMEGGRIYFDMAGCFRFEAADHLLGHTSAETFTVANLSDLKIQWDVENIANRVVVESMTRYLAVSQTIWQAQEVYRVPARIEAPDVAAGSTASIVNLTTSGTYGTDTLRGEYLRLTSGTYSGEYRKIRGNAVTTAGVTAVTVESPLSGAPAASDTSVLGGMLEIEARFHYPAANVVTPVAWTKALQDANGEFDYQALSGGGQDATTSLTIATTVYAASGKLLLINAAAQASFMVRMRLRGQPVLSRASNRTEEYDQTSIDAYQERDPLMLTGDQASVYVQNEVQAKAVAQMLLRRFKDPHAFVQIAGVKGDAAREIGRRITITETQSGINTDWFLVGITDRWSPSGGYSQDLTAVDATMLGTTSDGGMDFFILGTSKYGTGVGHGHAWY